MIIIYGDNIDFLQMKKNFQTNKDNNDLCNDQFKMKWKRITEIIIDQNDDGYYHHHQDHQLWIQTIT